MYTQIPVERREVTPTDRPINRPTSSSDEPARSEEDKRASAELSAWRHVVGGMAMKPGDVHRA